jgi:diaminopimelate decarboxylase
MSDGSTRAQWWERPDLNYHNEKLQFAGRMVGELARRHGTPSFFYNATRFTDNIKRLHQALEQAGFANRFRILFAMKSNRFAPLLTYLKMSGLVGIDACSPNEVEHAISCGFRPEDISFTNTSLSRDDISRLTQWDGMSMNCDSIHAIQKWGEHGTGRDIGIRINPSVGIGREGNDKLQYSGALTSKFGIYREQLPDAIAMAKRYNLTIRKIHFHTGCGYLTPQLATWENIIKQCLWFVDQIPTVEIVNVGGGLGVPHVAGDEPLDLTKWAAILREHFLHRPVRIEIEPGDYIAKDAGILCLTVNAVEQKQQTTFVGVNAGFAIALEPAVYGLPFQPVPAQRRQGAGKVVSIAGHINEALDVFYHGIELPPLAEDDYLVLINAGAYSSSMASNHCMRGQFKEFLLVE